MNKYRQLLSGILSYHKWVIALFLLATLACGWSARNFEIDASAETLLVKDNELYLQTRINNQMFAPEEFVLVAYKPRSGDIYAADSLSDIQTLGERFSAITRVSGVNSITNVPLITGNTTLTVDTDPDLYTWENQHYSADVLRDIFSDHPVFTNLLVNEEHTATAIQVVFEKNSELQNLEKQLLALDQQAGITELKDEQEQSRVLLQEQVDAINEQLAEQRSAEISSLYNIVAEYEDRADFYLGGSYVLGEHLISIIEQDLQLFGLVVIASVSVLLLLIFRDWRWVVTPLLCCVVSVIITVGLFALLGFKTTIISSNFIALQLILALALAVHLIVQYQILAQQQPDKDHHSLLLETVMQKTTPCLYAGITTSVGFASLLLSNLQPVITFGWMMIVAMTVSIAVSLILFPAFLAQFNERLSSKRHAISERLLAALHRLGTRHPSQILIIGSVLSLFAFAGIARIDVENSFLNYFKSSTQVRQELEFIDQEFGGSTPLDIVYTPVRSQNDGNAPELVMQDDTVLKLQQIQASLAQSEAVGKQMSVVNFTELAVMMNEGLPLTEYELNSLYTLLNADLKQELIGSYYHENSHSYRLNARIKDSTDNLDRQEFVDAVHSTIQELGIDENEYSISNLFVLYQDILQRLFSSQIMTLGFVYIALGLVMLCIFKSFTLSVIGLIPNIITTLSILGLMGWAGVPLDLMTITISAIAMGIAVDDTIHFIHHFRNADTASTDEALKSTFNTVGYAILYTSVIIAFGFSTLAFSDFVPGVLFGLLTASAMLIALITDVTILPALLHKFYHKK